MKYLAVAATLLFSVNALAQMPKNDEKMYEYSGTIEIKKIRTGELFERLSNWVMEDTKANGGDYLLDDSTNITIEMNGMITPVEAYFRTGYAHRDRELKYVVDFTIDKKSFNYKIYNFYYSFEEEDRKGNISKGSTALEEMKGGIKMPVLEEFDKIMKDKIAEITSAANTELPQDD